MTTTRNSLTPGRTGQIAYRERWEGTGGSPTPIYGGSAGGDRLWYQYNHLGTVVGLSDGAGHHVATVDTDAFGNPLASAQTGVWATSLGERGLTTKELDATSGMYYFYQRWYDPQTATFASRAPYPPMMEHPYGYGLNNPMVFVDPDGERWLYAFSDFCAGWGDSLSMGLTARIRDQTPAANAVNTDSSAYTAGQLTGDIHSSAMNPGRGAAAGSGNLGARAPRPRGTPQSARRDVRSGRGPDEISRIDKPDPNVPGSQWHAHRGGEGSPALNLDGTPRHCDSNPFGKEATDWLVDHGWTWRK